MQSFGHQRKQQRRLMTVKNDLDAIELHKLFYYDGVNLRWLAPTSNRVKKHRLVGTISAGYLSAYVHNKSYQVHRIIWELHNGSIPDGFVVDHKDGNKLNNKLENLRLCTQAENVLNCAASKNSKTKIKGVFFDKSRGKYRTQISVKGKLYFLGRFEKLEDAESAYRKASITLHGEFRRNC